MYDIVLDKQLVHLKQVKANQTIPFTIDDNLKLEIEEQRDRDRIIIWMIDLDEDAIPLGFNYVCKFFDEHSNKWKHKIEVFYFNRRIEWSNKMREDEISRRRR